MTENEHEHKKLSELRGFKSSRKPGGTYTTTVDGQTVNVLSVATLFDLEEFSIEVIYSVVGSDDVQSHSVSGPIQNPDAFRNVIRSVLDTFDVVRVGEVSPEDDDDSGMGWQR